MPMRIRKKPWAAEELAASGWLLRHPEERRGLWREFFRNQHPIHLEIGCGKGRFILAAASANPSVNYQALEREPMALVTALRAARQPESPARVLLGEAAGLAQIFAPGEIARVYIQLCDPWPGRKKWRKRRLTHENFLNIYRRLLGPQGELIFKTDNQELFDFSAGQLLANGWRLRFLSQDLHRDAPQAIQTEYEEKFAGQGLPIYGLEAEVSG
jgi:tRNA (guanine-N7-)-methyltransferase